VIARRPRDMRMIAIIILSLLVLAGCGSGSGTVGVTASPPKASNWAALAVPMRHSETDP